MSEKGQSLIEVMVALGVSVIILTAIVMSVVLAVVNTQFAKTQNLATYFAKQGLELLRQASQSDWNTFYSGSFCLPKNSETFNPKTEEYCPTGTNNFKREVIISEDETNCGGLSEKAKKVVVIVSWSDSKCSSQLFCHHVRLDSCFSKH